MPVIDDEKHVVDIISENDFLSCMGKKEIKSFMDIVARCLEGQGCPVVPLRSQKAEDMMTSPVITAAEDTLSPILRIFLQKKN